MAFPNEDLAIVVKAYLGADLTDDPVDWPAPVDFSDRLLDSPIRITTGRGPGQSSLYSGSCTLFLDNSDGALTPLLATSTYYPDWDLGVPMTVEVDLGSSEPRFAGYLASIDQTVVPGAGGKLINAVQVTIAGVTRRLGQGSRARSSLRRYLDRYGTSCWYWPLDGGDLATVGLPANVPAGYGGADLVVTEGVAGWGAADMGPALEAGVVLPVTMRAALVPSPTSTSSTGAAFVWRGVGNDTTILELRRSSPSVGNRWSLILNPTALTVQVTLNTNGSSVYTSSATSVPALFDGEPHSVSLQLTEAAGLVSVALWIDDTSTITGNFFGTLEQAAEVWVATFSTDEVAVSHLLVGPNPTPTFPIILGGYATGFPGENANSRFGREAINEGIPIALATEVTSLPCGPTTVADIMAVLRDFEAVDHGILYEDAFAFGLGYRPSDLLYNQSPALTIDLATYKHTGRPEQVLTSVRDDRRVRNEWTVSAVDGTPVTVKDTAHQARRGRYNDEATVNVVDDAAAKHDAGWRVHEGTHDGPRYATMPLDLGANPDLITDWLAARLGDRIDRTGHPSLTHRAGVASVLLVGYKETLQRRAWMVELNGEPYAPWQVNVLAEDDPGDDDPNVGWLEFDSCELAADVSSSATSWSVTCSPADSSDTDDFPRDHYIGGELVTVAASTGGTSPTWTVTRSVNGVVKAHSTGASIELADPLVFALT